MSSLHHVLFRAAFPSFPQAEPALELKSTVSCTAAAFLLQGPPPPLPADQQSPPDPLAAADSLALPPRPGDAAAQAAAAPQPRLLGGYVDGSLRLFSVEGGVELVWALARHAAPVMAVAPHPRKPLVLTAARWGLVLTFLRCIARPGPHASRALVGSWEEILGPSGAQGKTHCR